MPLFCYALLCVHSSFAIILKGKRKLAALLLLSYRCIVATNVLWLLMTVPWVGLQYVIVAFPEPTHFFVKNAQLLCFAKSIQLYTIKHQWRRVILQMLMHNYQLKLGVEYLVQDVIYLYYFVLNSSYMCKLGSSLY